MRILVTGGRDYGDRAYLFRVLSILHELQPLSLLIVGDAPGADRFAWQWAIENKVSWIRYPADWGRYGRAAGPIRNRQMLEAQPQLVLAFPGGRGTADMVNAANAAGVWVQEIG